MVWMTLTNEVLYSPPTLLKTWFELRGMYAPHDEFVQYIAMMHRPPKVVPRKVWMVENHGVVSLAVSSILKTYNSHSCAGNIPVKGRKRAETHAAVKASDHSQGEVLRRDPSHPVERVKDLEELVGEPAPSV